MPLTQLIDLIGRRTQLAHFLPQLATSLRSVAHFEVLGVVVPSDGWETAHLHFVRVDVPDGATAAQAVQCVAVAPLDKPRLAALADTGPTMTIFDRLDEPAEYADVIAALRRFGQRSAVLLPLATAPGPVGLMVFAASREGAYRQCDASFVQRIGALVAMAVDIERHQQRSATRERQLQDERDHWRTLLEVTNAVVTERDVAALRAAIMPNVRRIVPHDHTNLYLVDEQRRLGPFVIDPSALPWPEGLAAQIRLDQEPYRSLTPFDRAVDIDVVHADPKGWEALHAHVQASGVKRICNAPLPTPHRVLGILSLGRLTPTPFTSDELDRVAQVAAQIALALENALAFAEIASLKDRLARENIYLEEEIRGAQHFGEIVGESRALKRILSQVATVAPTGTSVLLLGETGTGKELVARAIHAAGDRRNRALVTVNCATSPAGLLESEWFGHERGAFTGALAQKIGRFELAHQGTLFLDEIGDVPLELQAKLLRALQEGDIERLGSTRTIRVDFRLIAATNRDLDEMIAKREFRSDLYYPAERVPDTHSGSAGASRGHSTARPLLHPAFREAVEAADRIGLAREHGSAVPVAVARQRARVAERNRARGHPVDRDRADRSPLGVRVPVVPDLHAGDIGGGRARPHPACTRADGLGDRRGGGGGRATRPQAYVARLNHASAGHRSAQAVGRCHPGCSPGVGVVRESGSLA